MIPEQRELGEPCDHCEASASRRAMGSSQNSPPLCTRCDRIHHLELWILAFLIMIMLTAFSVTVLYVVFEPEDQVLHESYHVATSACRTIGRLRYKLATSADRIPSLHLPVSAPPHQAQLLAQHAQH